MPQSLTRQFMKTESLSSLAISSASFGYYCFQPCDCCASDSGNTHELVEGLNRKTKLPQGYVFCESCSASL